MRFMQIESVLQTKNRSEPAKNRFSVALPPTTLIIPFCVLAIVQLKGISPIREAFCRGIQLLIAIIDAEREEKVTLTFEGHRM